MKLAVVLIFCLVAIAMCKPHAGHHSAHAMKGHHFHHAQKPQRPERPQAHLADEVLSADRPTDSVFSADHPSESVFSADRPSESVLSADRPSESVLSADRPSESVLSADRPSGSVATADRPTGSRSHSRSRDSSSWTTLFEFSVSESDVTPFVFMVYVFLPCLLTFLACTCFCVRCCCRSRRAVVPVLPVKDVKHFEPVPMVPIPTYTPEPAPQMPEAPVQGQVYMVPAYSLYPQFPGQQQTMNV